MKKLFAAAALTLAFVTSGFAQNTPGVITGSVSDGNKKTLEAPTIALLAARDSSVIKYTTADKSGKFSFEDVRAGKYLVAVTAVGHAKGYSEAAEISEAQQSVVLKPFELQVVSK